VPECLKKWLEETLWLNLALKIQIYTFALALIVAASFFALLPAQKRYSAKQD